MAWRAFREADDLMDAAERVDEAVDGHQEIVTLASLADPSGSPRSARSRPLVPAAMAPGRRLLERFDPNGAFAFEAATPANCARSLSRPS